MKFRIRGGWAETVLHGLEGDGILKVARLAQGGDGKNLSGEGGLIILECRVVIEDYCFPHEHRASDVNTAYKITFLPTTNL